ncbi:unnamed protein product, partial [Mesorhabditis belari]|uniref:Calcineurin-like phosphoesterase domain-containing protein n=1 Tax=Mesorhabditis belari TaxID=2138241 RepID=A0AAF3FRS9_9BILA
MTQKWSRAPKGKVTIPVQLNYENALNTIEEDGEHLKFVVISDTHCKMEEIMARIPDGDVLIHCGDFTNSGGEAPVKEFNEQLQRLPHRWKIVIAGNHERGFDPRDKYRPELIELLTEATYLFDSSIQINGLKIYGSPWIPTPEYAFYLSPDERKSKWAQIPADVDILITHGPPLGYLDARAKDQHYGDEQLLEAVEQRDPKFHVFGHIHECYGAMTNGRTIFVNAAQCDRSMQTGRLPIVFYIRIPAS